MRTVLQNLRLRVERTRKSRSGSIIALSAGVMVLVLAFAAFTIDVGYLALAKQQLQTSVDAATLAAVTEFDTTANQSVVKTNAENAAVSLAALNEVGNIGGLVLTPGTDIILGHLDWDPIAEEFIYDWGVTPYNIVKITGSVELPLFFAPVINRGGGAGVSMQTSAIGTYQPRDIILALDYSGSMNDDTEFKSEPSLGATVIDAAIDAMWGELGNPAYGSLPYAPAFITVEGVPEDTGLNIPHVSVEYQGDKVSVTSTLDLDQVVLRDSAGYYLTYSDLSGTSGVFADNRKIRQVWVESGDNGDLSPEGDGEKFEFYDDDIVTYLSLDAVTYPHSSGSWTSFVDYVNDDSDCGKMHYRYKYGTKCLINYWNEKKPKYTQTNSLWQITTQPLNAAKNASDILVDYIDAVEADDQVGLSIYTHTDASGAILESGLTFDVMNLKPLYRDRQAGHYDNMTNIGGGIKVAREELETNARPQSYKVIVLMTDGVANRPTGNPVGFAQDQADLCFAAGIKILTVSLGLGADQVLMQDLADRTGGEHFNVPGGGTIAEYEADLMAVFQEIAADRPLKLLPGP